MSRIKTAKPWAAAPGFKINAGAPAFERLRYYYRIRDTQKVLPSEKGGKNRHASAGPGERKLAI
jgi:hypothetical protein